MADPMMVGWRGCRDAPSPDGWPITIEDTRARSGEHAMARLLPPTTPPTTLTTRHVYDLHRVFMCICEPTTTAVKLSWATKWMRMTIRSFVRRRSILCRTTSSSFVPMAACRPHDRPTTNYHVSVIGDVHYHYAGHYARRSIRTPLWLTLRIANVMQLADGIVSHTC